MWEEEIIGWKREDGARVVIPLTISVTVAMFAACAYEHSDRGQRAPMGAEMWKMENNAVRETECYRNLMHRRRMFVMCEKARLRRNVFLYPDNPLVITLKIRLQAGKQLISSCQLSVGGALKLK